MRLIDADALKGAFLEELFVKSGKSVQDIIDQAPTIEPSGDLISRQDALMELNGACSNWKDDAKVAEIINALPSADKLKGEWEKIIVRQNGWYCSNCGKAINVDIDDIYDWHYCPRCGSHNLGGEK